MGDAGEGKSKEEKENVYAMKIYNAKKKTTFYLRLDQINMSI